MIDVSAPDGRESAYYAGMLSGPRFLAFTDDAGVPLPLANQRAVPEPSTWALLALNLPALLGFRRRR